MGRVRVHIGLACVMRGLCLVVRIWGRSAGFVWDLRPRFRVDGR